ncbi:MAG: damage-inducible protein J [Lachnospiraceae bacterium]|jgi:DNA-damage-inducible protein J|nr:damage-inducible protein J [Lachnospiraceae bacterium]MCI1327759.1 damage-inducible protein J [Lachnospiraceae bacterium]
MSSTAEMTNFTFKMDRKTREAYSDLCDSLGLTMSSATLALVKQAVRDQSMSFSLRDENGFTPAEAAELKRRIQDVRKGNTVPHELVEE